MLFELKERHTCRHAFHSQEELFEYLDTQPVTLKVQGRIVSHDIPGQMTYLGDVEAAKVPYRDELALYVHQYTKDEFGKLKRKLRAKAAELVEKWKDGAS